MQLKSNIKQLNKESSGRTMKIYFKLLRINRYLLPLIKIISVCIEISRDKTSMEEIHPHIKFIVRHAGFNFNLDLA